MHEWSEYWGTCDVSEVSVSPQHLSPCDVVLMGAMAGAFDGSTGVLLKFKGIDQNMQCCTLYDEGKEYMKACEVSQFYFHLLRASTTPLFWIWLLPHPFQVIGKI